MRVRNSGDAMVILEMGNMWIEIRCDDLANDFERARRQFHALRETLDKDGDKALSTQEVQNREPLRSLFPFMDRNHDDKLVSGEMTAALEALDELARGHALLEVEDRGGSLFGSLDASGEGRLGLRELRTAGRRLASFDRDGDRRVVASEIPRRFEWTFSQGPMTALFRNRALNNPNVRMPGPAVSTAKGPLWFQKMDRNNDGDLSPREFLGPLAEFRRLDADGDGLIDDREAAALHTQAAGEKAETVSP